MKAIRIHAYGGAENLKYDEVPRPEPQAGQVLIQVYAAGVNPIDWKIREGFFQQISDYSLPVIAGADVAGVVASVGDGVTTLQPGQAVYGTADMALSGAYAEYAVGYADAIAQKPKTLDYIHAASVPIVAITAWQALFDGANLQPDQSVLIHGGAGGVGRYAIQLAKWKRARVIATASAANLDDLRNLGADQAIDYASQPFEQQVKDVDVVLDLVGGETQARSWQIIRPGGVLVSTLGVPESGIPQGIEAVPVFANLRANSQLQQIAQLIDDGQIKASIEQVFELAEAAKAQEVSQHGHPRGKLVLQVVHPA
ncbi:NADP-dependent oxidoreductase [Nostoc sp. PA-18-2419]|uniref:NADP-dependent oxidoreductase n=1 Tax=Nostoc sp. PA-18-2419 TaxID=2575443 RepID=UPI00110991A0|nr:NADP-dependent oxidoreductase [Nostoc sp. PA-18-2419]